MTNNLNTQYIAEVLSRSYLTYEDSKQVIPWLRQAVEEIESLRSQLSVSEEQYKVLAEEMSESEELLQQAEQERDEWLDKNTILIRRNKRMEEANTAMREALEWYARPETYESWGDGVEIWEDKGSISRVILSRYPKEGGETSQ